MKYKWFVSNKSGLLTLSHLKRLEVLTAGTKNSFARFKRDLDNNPIMGGT
jgi:hypothetical protein